MNKTLSRVLIGLGIFVALIALVVALALVPAVQKWAVKRAVAGTPGTTVEVDRVSAGMSSAEVKNLQLQQDGAVIKVPSASAEYSGWGYLSGGGIHISRIDAKGVVVDLRNYAPKPGPAASKPASLQDILNLLLLPAGLQLEAADVDAEVIVPAPASPEGRRMNVTLKGGGVGSGSEATFDYDARYTDPARDAPVTGATAKGRLSFSTNAAGVIQKIDAHTEIRADGPQLPKNEGLVLDAGATRGKQSLDSFNVVVARRDKSGDVTPLVTATAALDPKSGILSGSWTLAADQDRLASVLPPDSTPVFEVSGSGKYSLNPETSASTAVGELKGTISPRDNVLTWLGVTGHIAFEANFDTATDAKAAHINSANARLSTSDGKVLFSLATQQKVDLALDGFAVKVARPSEPIASVEVGDLPLKWLNPFVDGGEFDGTAGNGGLAITMAPDGVGARTTRPLALRGVTAAIDGNPMIDGLDITWDGSFALSGDTVTTTTRSLEVSKGGAQLLDLKATATANVASDPAQMRGSAKGTLSADLGGLLAQPVAADFRVLGAGKLRSDFDLQSSDTISGKLRLNATGLVAADKATLGDVTLSIDGNATLGKSGEFTMPLTVQNSGRKSDLTVAGKFTQTPDLLTFNGSITGDTVYLADLQPLGALVPANPANPQTSPTAPAESKARDVKPFWSGVGGTFDVAIKKLFQDPSNPIADLNAKAVAGPDMIALEQFSGSASGGTVSANASLTFAAKEQQPYELKGSFKVPSFDVGAYFKAADPRNPPELETVVTADGTFSGRGVNLDDLSQRAQGTVNLKGGKGVYRGLAKNTTTTVASVGAGLLGAFVKDDRVQTGTQMLASLTDALKEFQFDEMTLKASRGTDLKLNVESLEFRAPAIRVTGTGYVNMEPDKPFAKQTQHFEMTLAFKDTLAARMSQVHMLTAQKDSLGYSPLRIPINLTGTLLAPDTTQFWTDIAKSMAPSLIQQLLPGG